MARSRPLPPLSFDEVISTYPALRQSLLGMVDTCALMAKFEMEGVSYDNAAQGRGILFHRTAGEILRTLWQRGAEEMEVAEALEIMYETCEQRNVPDHDVVWIPMVERRTLRRCVKHLVWNYEKRKPQKFTVGSILLDENGVPSIEQRLWAKVRYPLSKDCPACEGTGRGDPSVPRLATDRPERQVYASVTLDDCQECGGSGRVLAGGTIERLITGQPDVLIGEPPDGIVVLDWKTSRQAPPEGDNGDHEDDADHVSYMGYFQQRTYALLAFANYPWARYVKLREYYPLPGVSRYATVYRHNLEHIERELATIAELVDRALMGGSKSALWRPSPGAHCAFCPRKTKCPIEADVRAFDNGSSHGGGIASKAEARKLAGEGLVAKRVYDAIMKASKPWVDTYGPIDLKSAKGRMVLDWKRNKTGDGRRFVYHVPADSDRGPDEDMGGPSAADLDAAFKAIGERAKGAAT